MTCRTADNIQQFSLMQNVFEFGGFEADEHGTSDADTELKWEAVLVVGEQKWIQ